MNIRSTRSGLLVLVAAAVCTHIADKLQRRRLEAFGVRFDEEYKQAAVAAEENWADIERLAVLDLNGPIKPEHLDRIMMLKANYLWYYCEHATRGVMLQGKAMSQPLRVRLLGRDACMRNLLQFHREGHDRLLRVREDLRSSGIPGFFLRAPFRDLTPTYY